VRLIGSFHHKLGGHRQQEHGTEDFSSQARFLCQFAESRACMR